MIRRYSVSLQTLFAQRHLAKFAAKVAKVMTNLNTSELDQHHNENVEQNCYKNAVISLSKSNSNMDKLPIIINFALPLTSEMFNNSKLLDSMFVEAVMAVKNRLNSNEITIFKTTILRNKGNLKCITVIIPYKLENAASSLIHEGITLRNRKIRPYSVNYSNPNNNVYPKRLPISFRNLPHFLTDEDILSSCGLQNFKFSSKIFHQQRRLPDSSLFHTGEARITVLIDNENEESLLQNWANNAYDKMFSSSGIFFKCCCIPLLECSLCVNENLPSAHQQSRCPKQLSDEQQIQKNSESQNQKLTTDYVMETAETEPMSNEPELSDSDDAEPISKAPKQTDDGTETECNNNVAETEQPCINNSKKDTIPMQKPKLMHRSTEWKSSTDLARNQADDQQSTAKHGYHEYPFFLEKKQNKILAPETIFNEIPPIKEHVIKTQQTSGYINTLDKEKKIQRTFSLVQPLKKEKLEDLLSESNWKHSDSNTILTSHFEFYSLIRKFDPFYDATNHQIYTINLENKIVQVFTAVENLYNENKN